jgi:Rps23 Pro-64 3,4-dihydroxylase Tpa1-like proline 4-hydroxylase
LTVLKTVDYFFKPRKNKQPQLGQALYRFILRSAGFWHEVMPSKRPRLSLTGWLRGREELPHLASS